MMMEQGAILVTGGSGLLGRELRSRIPGALFPPHAEFDVTDPGRMASFPGLKDIRLVVHAAALTSPPRVDKDPAAAITANVIGTANVVKLCLERGARLVYISTDYVFDGSRGMYTETDPVLPVNAYAWSKLGGECAARLYDKVLIVRTSFGPNEFPYEKAFVDQWTSRLPVREFVDRLLPLLDSDLTGVVHVGGPRRTVFAYATAVSPAKKIAELRLSEVPFKAPRDTSLDTTRYQTYLEPGREK
jgi:dTDP-4-dehydrorhamnose reductase